MADAAKYLLPTERVAIKIRLHWAVLAADTLRAIALLAIGVLLARILGSIDFARMVLVYFCIFVVLQWAWTIFGLVSRDAHRHRQAAAAADRHLLPERRDHAAGQGHRPDLPPVRERDDLRLRQVRRGERRPGPGAVHDQLRAAPGPALPADLRPALRRRQGRARRAGDRGPADGRGGERAAGPAPLRPALHPPSSGGPARRAAGPGPSRPSWTRSWPTGTRCWPTWTIRTLGRARLGPAVRPSAEARRPSGLPT